MKAHLFILLCCTAIAGLTGCGSQNHRHYIQYQQQPENESIEHVGLVVVNSGEPRFLGGLESSGPYQGAGGMLYGPGAAGFAAMLAAHAITQSAVDEAKAAEAQAQANLILDKYQSVLARYTDSYIAAVSLASLNTIIPDGKFHSITEHPENFGFIIEMSPVFYMAQDEKSLVLKNAITIYKDLPEDKIVYQNMIQAIAVTESSTPSDYWLAQDGQELSRVVSGAIIRSIEAAMKDAGGHFKNTTKAQTIAYKLSDVTHYERGTVLIDDCDKRVVRTLRGWIYILPQNIMCGPDEEAAAAKI
ncbi:hypothetical protein G8764_16885 [Pseudomaricurvus alcaniphilus]|uniref:hypothetical protein n=1 Tax=Pseudomaricurvus alcaniphilus TaxID=1166482 RepID=UPI00140C85FC|nr:hypothetical protein [Pseudomaricurvus alcaniphilus]NHN38987.1 hypothetical protein [Pseudomaricurvus alcaniphilus]